MSIVVDDPGTAYPTVDVVWKKFMLYFEAIGGLFSYAPVFRDYWWRALEECRQDNVQYIEVRALLSNVNLLHFIFSITITIIIISITHTSLVAFLRFSALNVCLYATLSFITVPIFSIRLRSGLFLSHSSTAIWFIFRNSVAVFVR